MIKAIIFDLDGTIGNTLPLCIAAFRKAVEPLSGRSLSDEEIVATFGPSEEGMINALIPNQYEKGIESYLTYYCELHDMCPEPFAGIHEIIKYLKRNGIILALVTGKGTKSTAITLSKYGMESLFDAVETGSPLGPRKVKGIENVLKRFGLKPQEAIYVGDTPSDIISARTANIPSIAAAWADTADIRQLKEVNPDEIFFTIKELGAFLKRELAGYKR
jgi:phosphoglycolate phosphatase-like HAD superfamily hydrolase